jgi:SAM-dependent methyltransferase
VDGARLEVHLSAILVTTWICTCSRGQSCLRLPLACSRSAAATAPWRSRWPLTATTSSPSTRAPDGPIFRQIAIEELGDEGPFDGAVASLSLHHVHDLGVAVERVRSLLRSGGPFMVREFAWNLVDEPTARWDYARRGREGGLAEWRAEHDHLHGFEAMRSALDARFRERRFEWGAYLSEFEPGERDVSEERRLIEAGVIRAVGFLYVGEA